eukprot:gene32844-39715_t
MTTPCPCNLTQDQVLDLDRRDRVVLVSGLCQNPRADGADGVCGLALGAHPTGLGLTRLVDVESSVVVLRALLESQVRQYIQDHVKYVNNTKSAKCCHILTAKTPVSEALDHLQCCSGQLETWRAFKNNSKLYTSAPGRRVYAALSESVHTASVRENKVHVPEFLEPIPKRFLLRLFKILGYRVQVVDVHGNVRDPVPDELETPHSSSV